MVVLQLLATAALAAGAPASLSQEGWQAQVSMPEVYVEGRPFPVSVTYRAGDEGAELEAWRFAPAAFERDGESLGGQGARDGAAAVPLAAGSTLTLELDLSAHLGGTGNFELALAGGAEGSPRQVVGLSPAPEGLDFLGIEPAALANYIALLRTNQGEILIEFWPDVAPEHVRNYLDLCASGFYAGTQFHRVSPSFMVQGGCPNTKTEQKSLWGTGSGPRMLTAEFNDRKHVRGVLSMARGPSPNSGSCQFFLMTATSPHLDGQYSAFGTMISGFDTLDRIANAPGRKNPRDGTTRPDDPQRIEETIVLQRPAQ